MQINSNTVGYTNVGTNTNLQRQDITDRKPAAKLVVRDAIKPEQQVQPTIDQNGRGAQLARNAYNGSAQRGSIVNIFGLGSLTSFVMTEFAAICRTEFP